MTGYHVANLLLHGLAACLFAVAIRSLWSLGSAESPSWPVGADWAAAFLFAIHPVCVESVAWVSEQKNTLSLVFYLSAAITYVRFRTTARWRWYWIAFVFFVLALGSKTVTATLPAALLVLLWWRRGRVGFRDDILPLVPWFAVGIAAGLTTAWVEKHFIGATGASFELPVANRFLLAARVIWHYLKTVLWPHDLMFFYPLWNAGRAGAIEWVSIMGVTVLTVVLWLFRSRVRGVMAAWLVFVGGLFPALGFFNVYPFQFSFVADHFQYLPNLAVFACLGYGIAVCIQRSRTLTLAFFALVSMTLVVISRSQASRYVDNETLSRATIALNPSGSEAHDILGAALRSQSRYQEAMEEFRTSIRLNPNGAYAHLALGIELAKQPATKVEAIEEMRRAVEIRPGYADAHNNLGLELQTQGDLAGAKREFEAAIQYNPASAEAHLSLGQLYLNQPNGIEQAKSEFEAAIKVRPYFAPAHAQLANLLVRSGELGEAITHFRVAVQADPDVTWVHRNLAMALAQVPGGMPQAIEEGKMAVRLDPQNAESHNALAILFAQSGDFTKARAEWLEALRLKPDYESARRNLARLQQTTP